MIKKFIQKYAFISVLKTNQQFLFLTCLRNIQLNNSKKNGTIS